jgi:hypothetical protein
MSTHASVGNFPLSATEEQLRQQSDHMARVDLDTVVTEPQPALDARPVWKNGTLPGVMAGKRPAPSLSV